MAEEVRALGVECHGGAGRCGRPRAGVADVRRGRRAVRAGGRAGKQRRHPPAQALHRADAGPTGSGCAAWCWTARSTAPATPCRRCRPTASGASCSSPATGPGTARRSVPTSRRPRWASWDWPGGWPRSSRPHNVRVNVVSPGRIDTSRDLAWYPGQNMADTSEIPLGRLGHVDDIAAACVFLATDDCGFITGQTIHVNGGTAYF